MAVSESSVSTPRAHAVYSILRFESLPSTNEKLLEMVQAGAANSGTVIVVEHQTAGRGRRGRTWLAEPGSALLASVYIATNDPQLAYAACGLSVRDAIQSLTGIHPDLKWPNDVLIDGLKVCGILSTATGSGIVAGFGINVNMDRQQLARIGSGATSLLFASSKWVDREALLTALLGNVQVQFERLAQSPKAVFGDWRAALVNIGQVVEVETARETWIGRAIDVAEDGALLVTNGDRIIPVYAADVRLSATSSLD